MADAMKGVTKAMKSMNAQVNLPAIQKIMMDFERESEVMDMKEEMMSDAIDDVMDEEGEDEEESEQIVQQVFDEIGINLDQQVSLVERCRCSFRAYSDKGTSDSRSSQTRQRAKSGKKSRRRRTKGTCWRRQTMLHSKRGWKT